MDFTNQQIINEVIKVIEILFTIGGALLAIYKTNVKSYFNAKADGIKDENLRTLAKDTIDVIDNLVTTEVTNADVVLKPAIIQAISDGKVTKDELNTLKPIVIDKVKSQLTKDSQDALSSSIANLDTYLDSKVETILANLKLDPNSAVSKTIINNTIDNTVEENQEIVNSTSDLQQSNPNKEIPDNPDLILNNITQTIDSNIVIPQ